MNTGNNFFLIETSRAIFDEIEKERSASRDVNGQAKSPTDGLTVCLAKLTRSNRHKRAPNGQVENQYNQLRSQITMGTNNRF